MPGSSDDAAVTLDAIDAVVKAYAERYGRKAKPAAILAACRDWAAGGHDGTPPATDQLIRLVWRRELGGVAEGRRAARIAQLRNSFAVNKRILNRRLFELGQEGKNPLLLGLTEGNAFGVLSDRTDELARKERSPWVTEWIAFELEILDPEGRTSRMMKRERLVPLVKGLTQFTHEIGSDGEVRALAVQPGRIYRQERRAGKLEVLQILDREFPEEGGEVELSYEETDAYRNVNEYWVYTCGIPTRGEVTFVARFPRERAPREASAYLVGPAWSLSLLPNESQPTLSIQEDGRHQLCWRMRKPKYRERYEVRWRW